VLLAERPEAVGRPFFLASRQRTTLEEIEREVARALGVAARTVPLPPRALAAAAWAADLVSSATRRRLPLNRKLARQLLAPGWTCHPDRAERLLGFSAPTTMADSISRAARFYREQGWLGPTPHTGR
jgi:nucleoside-diphosphate-sugar epimerase